MIELGKEHFYIELIEEYQCDNVEQLRAREGHFIRQMGTLNARIEGRTKKEYTIDTKDIKREYDMKRREEKREEINAKKKQHYEKNKEYLHEKFTCEICGGKLTRCTKHVHLKTTKHQQALQQ